MTDATPTNRPEERTPRVALMGEFSAGKSTLSNLLLAADPMPVKITATRLPPVWITYGDDQGLREDIDGTLHPLGEDGLDSVSLEDTRLIQMQMQSGILKFCDLVDMPGISDPNMASDVWRDVIEEIDVVVWCTHATQAWRQSEAATFETLPEHLKSNAILLITRFDKLRSDRDRSRVMARVQAETTGLFRAIYPISLTDALSAGEDRGKWDRSGAEPFIKGLLDTLSNPQDAGSGEDELPHAAGDVADPPADIAVATPPATDAPAPVKPARVTSEGISNRRPARPRLQATTEAELMRNA